MSTELELSVATHDLPTCRTFVSESGWQAGERGAVSEAFITDEASRKPLTAVEQFLFWLVLLYGKVKFSLFRERALCPTGSKTET